jgi:hypothetical protein
MSHWLPDRFDHTCSVFQPMLSMHSLRFQLDTHSCGRGDNDSAAKLDSGHQGDVSAGKLGLDWENT